MAVLVLVLWMLTAGLGFSTLLTSNLGRTRPTEPAPVLAAQPATAAATAAPAAATAAASAATAAASAATAAASAATAATASAVTSAPPAGAAAPGPQTPGASERELKQARRKRFDPPSLVAARQAPVLPGARALLEFAHPAFGIIGLAFWLGFTLVHNRVLGWIAFGLVAVTATAGLAWFTANLRAAKRHDQNKCHDPDRDELAPSFRGRLVALHGGAAALTVVLATLTALILH